MQLYSIVPSLCLCDYHEEQHGDSFDVLVQIVLIFDYLTGFNPSFEIRNLDGGSGRSPL